MSEIFTALHRFNDPETVEQIGETLARNGIPYIINDLSGIGGRSAAFVLQLKVKFTDLERAEELLQNYYGEELLQTAAGHHLFNLRNEELLDMVKNPGRVSLFDYQLSRAILRHRDVAIDPETVRQAQKQRFIAGMEQQSPPWWLFFIGYFFAVGGGLIGLIIGWNIIKAKRTLLTGEEVPAYRPADRQHGIVIMVISCLVLFIGILIKLNKK